MNKGRTAIKFIIQDMYNENWYQCKECDYDSVKKEHNYCPSCGRLISKIEN